MPPPSPGIPSLASIWQLLELHRPALAETAARRCRAADVPLSVLLLLIAVLLLG